MSDAHQGDAQDEHRWDGEGGLPEGVPPPRPDPGSLPRASLLAQVWRGHRSPLEVFVVWNVLIGGVLICLVLGDRVLPWIMVRTPDALWLPAAYAGLAVLYALWALTGLWRSGAAYAGPLAVAVKMLAGLNALLFLAALYFIAVNPWILPALCKADGLPGLLCGDGSL